MYKHLLYFRTLWHFNYVWSKINNLLSTIHYHRLQKSYLILFLVTESKRNKSCSFFRPLLIVILALIYILNFHTSKNK